MSTWRHLLAASDGSPEGGRALAAAVALAQGCGARLTLLQVVEPPPGGRRVLHPGDEEEMLEQLRVAARAVLRPICRQARSLGLDCLVEIIPGSEPWRVIEGRVAALGCDLLVLGRHNRGWLDTLRAPSQMQALVTHVPCDLLVVP